VQFLGNWLVMEFSLYVCTVRETSEWAILFSLYMALTFGVSVIGTNLLAHRYLHKKASTVVKIFNNDSDPAVRWLKVLEWSFVWEVRTLYLVPVGVPLFLTYQSLALIVVGVGAALLIFLDSVVSLLLTLIFLSPIIRSMRDANASHRGIGYIHMQRTKWLSLGGAVITVLSSSLLYIIVILYISSLDSPSVYVMKPWLNIYVFPINADSILNDLGMMILSGMARRIFLEIACSKKISTTHVNPAPRNQTLEQD